MSMKKRYKFQLPQNKEVKGTNVRVENGEILVDVEFEEKFEPKDGDFLVSCRGGIFICSITKSTRNSYGAYCGVNSLGDIIISENHSMFLWTPKDGCRYATEQEKSDFLERLEKERHKRWNAETKFLEDIRWKPKEGEEYWFIDYDGGLIGKTFENTPYDRIRIAANNCFKTEETARPYADKIKEILKNSKSE